MDQQRTGAFLKCLRKEKGLTQEQLAEQFYISSKTVSRWETGSNLPDVGTLIDLADFYDVDIRELIDGERKRENMDKETKDTLKKVAAYASEGEKRSQSKVVSAALVISIVLFICTILFADERPGLLYGIVPEDFCRFILSLVYISAACLLIAYLKVRWAFAKPTDEPVKTVSATVIAKEIKQGTQVSGRSMMGYSFAVTFQTEDGQTLELYTYEIEFGGLKEGMRGTLTHQGRYFVSFEEA